MKKGIVITILLFIIIVVHAQEFSISFQPKEAENTIDSVLATNLRTNKNVSLLGGESLNLVKYLTGSHSVTNIPEVGFVYPNPSDCNVMLSFSIEKSQSVEIGLYDNLGKLLSSTKQNLTQGIHQFELKFPVAGIYYVSVLKSEGQSGFKTVYTGRTIQHSSILYVGSHSVNDLQGVAVTKLKGAAINKEIEFEPGDMILYSFFSGKNTTIFTDAPDSSKTIDVEFVKCTDNDSTNYKVVKIGTQWWMAENLAYLPVVSPPSLGSDTIAFYYVYDYTGTDTLAAKATENYNTYGVLYNWPAAKASCPAGWHLPSDAEWKQLEISLGMKQQQADTIGWRGTDQGKKMKSTFGWNSAGNGTNSSGFTALPSGYRYSSGLFMHLGNDGCWWTSTDFSTNEPWYHFITFWKNQIHRNHNYNFRKYAWAVRCVKD